jgi:hypothetical protein
MCCQCVLLFHYRVLKSCVANVLFRVTIQRTVSMFSLFRFAMRAALASCLCTTEIVCCQCHSLLPLAFKVVALVQLGFHSLRRYGTLGFFQVSFVLRRGFTWKPQTIFGPQLFKAVNKYLSQLLGSLGTNIQFDRILCAKKKISTLYSNFFLKNEFGSATCCERCDHADMAQLCSCLHI